MIAKRLGQLRFCLWFANRDAELLRLPRLSHPHRFTEASRIASDQGHSLDGPGALKVQRVDGDRLPLSCLKKSKREGSVDVSVAEEADLHRCERFKTGRYAPYEP